MYSMSKHRSVQPLPDELVVNILSRLPLKSLSRSKCVSILWRQLSNSLTVDAFIKDHLHYSHPNCIAADNDAAKHHVLFQQASSPPMSPIWRLLSFPKYYNNHIIADIFGLKPTITGHCVSLSSFFTNFTNSSNICNGLVCFFNKWSLPFDLSPISVYNIATQEFVILPTRCEKPFSWKDDDLWCSLGFDPIQEKYHVLRTITSTLLVNSSYQILSLGSNSWKQLDDHNNVLIPSSLRVGSPCDKTSSLCVDGVIYWIHNSQTCNKIGSSKILHIAAFDLGRKEFRSFSVNELVGCSYKIDHTYFLTSVNGCPTLFFWKKSCHGMLQLTLSDHTNANCSITWSKIEISRGSSNFNLPSSFHIYVGSSIIVTKSYMSDSSYVCFDYENGARWFTET